MATSINFPDSPSQGDTYTYSGVTYEFDGTTWQIQSGGSVPPVADNSVNYDRIASDLKGSSAISATSIDWSASAVFTKTLSGNTTFTFSNLQLNKVITVVLSGNYTVTLPSYVKIISGEYDGSSTNYIQFHCTNSGSGSEQVWCVISQEAN